MARLPIGEVARRSGLRASAIRFYEERGLLPRVEREGGRRIYGEEVLDRLAVIELAKRSGFTLAEIRGLLVGLDRGGSAALHWRAAAGPKLAALDRTIAEATRMRALLVALRDCACPGLADCGRALQSDRRAGGSRGRAGVRGGPGVDQSVGTKAS